VPNPVKLVRYAAKYGPHVLVAAQALKEPAKEYAAKQLAAQRAKRAAFAEAQTLKDGSVLKVFHAGEPVWVVYAADDPVTAHPAVAPAAGGPALPPLAELVARADLAGRVRPADVPSPADRARAAAATTRHTVHSAGRKALSRKGKSTTDGGDR